MEAIFILALGLLILLAAGPVAQFLKRATRLRRRRSMFAEYFPDDDPKGPRR